MIAFSRSFNSNRCSVNACPSKFSPQPSHRLFPPKCITSPSSSGAPQSSTDHKLFKERLVGEVLPKHVDVLEDGLDDCVDVPLPVVRQLHRYQHQAEPDTICNGCQSVKVQRPGHEEVLVCGDDVVGQPLLLQVGEQRARTSVAQQVAQVPARSNLFSS